MNDILYWEYLCGAPPAWVLVSRAAMPCGSSSCLHSVSNHQAKGFENATPVSITLFAPLTGSGEEQKRLLYQNFIKNYINDISFSKAAGKR